MKGIRIINAILVVKNSLNHGHSGDMKTHFTNLQILNYIYNCYLELETEKRRERPKFFDCIRDMSNLDQVWQLPTKMKDKREAETS